jgi:hypothetical protein
LLGKLKRRPRPTQGCRADDDDDDDDNLSLFETANKAADILTEAHQNKDNIYSALHLR